MSILSTKELTLLENCCWFLPLSLYSIKLSTHWSLVASYSNYEFGRFKNLLKYLTVGVKPEWLFQLRPLTFLRLPFIVFWNHGYNLSLLWVGGWSCPCFSSGHQWVVSQLYLDTVDFRDSDSCHLPYWLQWFLIQEAVGGLPKCISLM